jgi:uncharacterized protein (DUF427 family)
MWAFDGSRRPPFAADPGPGQESVWDYPRPPRTVPDIRHLTVSAGGVSLASTRHALRVLETASPPSFYLPLADVDMRLLVPAPGRSYCEWKGLARYWLLAASPGLGPVAWGYAEPAAAFAAIRDHVSFYPARVDCHVDGERVRPQPGGFYGGWVTDEIVGPVKGEPGTSHW